MDGPATENQTMDEGPILRERRRWRKKRYLVSLALLLVILAVMAVAWLSRESIAEDFIQDQIEAYDLPATYKIERIGGQAQVLTDVVIGDPAFPDFTAERVIVRLRYRIGLPAVGRITLVEPRIYGTYRRGVLSFGSLDKVLFRETGEPPGLPRVDVAIRDGRGLIETDYGPVGIKAEGAGLLTEGFAGILALNAPRLALPGCSARGATAYGKVTSSTGKPRFDGPVRLASLQCPEHSLALVNFAADVGAGTDATLANPGGEARFRGGRSSYGDSSAQTLLGTIRAGMRGDAITARYTLAARGVETPQVLAAVLTAEGDFRARDGFERFELDGAVEGNGLRLGRSLVASLDGLSRAGQGTLIAPIARQIANSLLSETRGSAIEADIRLKKDKDALTLLAPRAEIRGGSGARILALSRAEWSSAGNDGAARIAGNIATGGAGLPRVNGRMERGAGGDTVFRLTMAPYEAGSSRLAIPQLMVAQGSGGALGFSGRIEASGQLPGGSAQGLRLPVSGRWQPGGELVLWRECAAIGFDRLVLANLRFEKRDVTLCPPRGGAIVRNGAGGLRVAAGAPSLDLAGYLGETPIRLATGPIGFAYPGVLKARAVAVSLGPPATASEFVISDLDARIGDNIAGNFSDAEVRLANVPLDVAGAAGQWDYTRGKFSIADAGFTLTDRAAPDRFEPLIARGATLTLVDNRIDAFAELRHPGTDRVVTAATIRHNLATATGYANLNIAGLRFDEALQPDQLTTRALGVIANAEGTITGTGRIDWNASGMTSSGEFSTDDFDFAAAFGPVRGASGTIVFSDLLGLTTAPNQRLRVASVNPGIEVLDGEIEFQLREGQLLAVAGGRWPFMGGTLTLRNVDFNFGVSEERRYIFEIEGLEAAQFIAQMELENISATGTFDGTIPIVFDANGNGRIEEGVLISRPPGGNISYIGALTYEDLSPIANFAFEALKSLNYSQMRVVMEGPLTGEIVTRVRFDGVSQGEGAKRNFITKQLAKLPIQFRINIRAQFYQLITSLKSLYDPAAVRDPRELGLLSDDGRRLLRRSVTGEQAEPENDPADVIPDEPPIQDQESE